MLKDENRWQDVAKNAPRDKQVFKDNVVGEAAKKATMAVPNWINNISNGKLQNLVDTMDKSMTNSVMENLRKFDYWLLGEVEDNPFVKSNFNNRLASYMKAQGIKNIDDVPNDAIQLAYQEALKATFKDDNYMTKAFQGIKQNTGKFGEVMLPFVKTPANLAKRGIEYSPIGFVETLMTAKGKQADQIIDALSKNAVGTAGIFLGYQLAKNGLIQGALSTDKNEKAFEKQQGKVAFSIKAGDHYYSFDWAQPASIPLIIGATINDAINEDDEEKRNIADLVKQGTTASIDAWADLSPISSLQSILGGGEYSSDSIGENILNAIAEFPQRLIPAVFGATARTIDPTYRTTYSNGDTSGSYANTVKSKIPFLSETLPASYDTWGRERQRQDSKGAAFVANFLNPGTLGYNASTPIDSEIQRIGAYPNAASWSVKVNGNNIKLNNEQYSNYQKAMGQYSYDFASKLLETSTYKNLNDEGKKEALSKLYSIAKSMAENELFNKPISDSSKKYVEVYKSMGTDGLIEYLDIKLNADSDGNGSLKAEEITNYLDSKNLTKEEKNILFGMLSNAKNNPYTKYL